MSDDLINDLLKARAVEVAIREVSKAFGFSAQQIVGRESKRELQQARHLAIALAHDFSGATYVQLGRRFDRRATSIAYSILACSDAMVKHPYQKARADNIRKAIAEALR